MIFIILVGCQTRDVANVEVINQASGLEIIEIVNPKDFSRLDDRARK